MLKKVFGKKLSRGGGSRKALFRGLVRALVESGKIVTTKAKAKAIQGQIDKIMVLTKKEDQASRRRLLGILGNDKVTFESLIKRYLPSTKERRSGFTRIISLPRRRGDQAETAIIEFVDRPVEIKKEKKVKKEKKQSKSVSKKSVKKVTKASPKVKKVVAKK